MKLMILLLFLTIPVAAQSTFTIDKGASTIMVKGTSSAHDWESNAEDFSGTATITVTDGAIETISGLSLDVVTGSIKSGKRVMDNKTSDALKAKDNPSITFSMASLDEVTATAVTVSGSLNLAGVAKEIVLTGDYTIGTDGSLIVTGVQSVNMKDYGIDPPTAMMGALKTGEEVNVEFTIKFNKN